jgi:hypothetical protein
MATAYQTQQYNNYGTRQDTAYSVAPPSYSNSAAATNPYLPATFVARTTADGTAGAVQPYVRPQSPRDVARPTTEEDAGRRKSVILPSLQIPSSINNSGGSLGEFAAQVRDLKDYMETMLTFFPDHLFILVRIHFDTAKSRRTHPEFIPCATTGSRCDSYNGIPKMGCYNPIHNTGYAECHIVSPFICLQAQDFKSNS